MHFYPKIYDVENNPKADWTGALEGPYTDLPAECGEVEIPIYTCPGVDDGAFVHHPMVHQVNNKILLMWSEHPRDEDCGGLRVMWTYSDNGGFTWAPNAELQERLSDVIYTGDTGTNWACRPSCWATVGSGTYAMLDVFEHKKSGQVGMLAVPIDPETKTIGTPAWFLPGVAPTTPGAYPQYSVVSASLFAELTELLERADNKPRWAAGSESYWTYTRETRIEPTGVITPPPFNQDVILWRDKGLGGDASKKWVDSTLTYTNDGQRIYEITGIPDDPSTGALRMLSGDMIGYVSNDDRDTALRERLFYVEAHPGNFNFGKDFPIYNVAEGSTVTTEYPGAAKAGGPQYGDFVENSAGYIICAYSVFKQDIRVTRFRRPSRLNTPIELPAPTASVQFTTLSFEGNDVSTTSANYPEMNDSNNAAYQRTWQLTGALTGVDDLVMNGGNYPNDYMIQTVQSSPSPLVSGRNFVRHVTGVPYAVGNNVYWGTPGVFDTTDPAGTGVLLNTSSRGPFRLHYSMNYLLNAGGDRSTIHKDVLDGTRGRLGRVSLNDGSRLDLLNVDPFLQPASANATLLDGTPAPNMRYIHFAVRLVSDSDTMAFYWPGTDTGNYDPAAGTDAPHYAINIWQKKGKFSGTVTLNMKWQGERMYMIQQAPDGTVSARGAMIGVNGVVTIPLSDFANMWLNFVVRVVPGQVADGDTPQADIYFKNPLDSGNWVNIWSQSVDILSEIEDFTIYGIPQKYIGTSNGGFYPSSNRIDGVALSNDWAPVLDLYGTTKYIKIDHAEQRFFDCRIDNDPGYQAVLNSVDQYLA